MSFKIVRIILFKTVCINKLWEFASISSRQFASISSRQIASISSRQFASICYESLHQLVQDSLHQLVQDRLHQLVQDSMHQLVQDSFDKQDWFILKLIGVACLISPSQFSCQISRPQKSFEFFVKHNFLSLQ